MYALRAPRPFRPGLPLLLTTLLASLTPATLAAQQPPPGPGLPAPRLLLVLPCGGQQGATQEIVVTGQELDEPQTLHFNFPGTKVEMVGVTTAPKIEPGKKNPKMAASPANSYRFKVTLPAAAPLGIQDVRVVTKYGVSNPRAFVVGDGKEFVEQEPNDDVAKAQRIDLNGSVSGVISGPTDVDYFRFAGKKGQRVVVSCLTTSIDSRLPASVEVYYGDRFLAFNRNYHQNDALCDLVLPADGDYDVRVCSFGYTQSGADHFYRLTVSTAPWIDAIHPCVVERGKPTDVTVYGRNLPGGKPDPTAVVDGRVLDKLTYRVNPPAAPLPSAQAARLDFSGHIPPYAAMLDGFEVRLTNAAGKSNPYLLAIARAPVVLDNEANDTAATAQRLTLPCEIAGRIEKKADKDWYVFAAKKGQILSIEVYGERLGSPLDLSLQVRSAATGKTVVELDDTADVMSPQLYSRTDDPPRYRFVAPADGDYQLLVTSRDAFIQAGPRHVYRVRVTPEQPDFRVVAMPPGAGTPDSATVRRGGQQALTLYVFKLDGWEGDITVTADNLPPGVSCPPQVLAAGSKQGVLVVSASAEAPLWTGSIRLVATAKIQGQEVRREVRSATTTWVAPAQQANTPVISRLDRDLLLAVREQGPFNLTATATKFTVQAGGKVRVPLKLQRFWPELTGAVQVTALDLSKSLTLTPVAFAAGKDSAEVVLDVKTTAPPGVYTVLLRGQVQVTATKSMPTMKKPLTLVQPANPVSIIVLPKQIVKLGVAANVKLKAGQKTEVPIKLGRLTDLGGDLKVELVLPPNTQGVRADVLTVGADATDVTLAISTTPAAAVGPINNALLRVTLTVGGMAVTQDTKIGLTVVK